jgi:D-aspartate ligase
VAGAYYTGVALMRSLARRGVPVCCIDSGRLAGFKTVYGPAYLCPNPDEQLSAWTEFMIGLAKRLGGGPNGKPVLICSSDRFINAIAESAEQLEPYFRFCKTSVAAQALLATKQRQYDLAGSLGLAVPRTRSIHNLEEAIAFGAEAKFPCLIKPLHFRHWHKFEKGHPLYFKKLTIIPDRSKLPEIYQMAAAANPQMVIQEIIEGPDTAKLVYLSCYSQKGERIAHCMMRQLRTSPIHFGSASVVEPTEDPEADQRCDEFLRGLHYAGICEIELKRDSRDNSLMMIEANPRFSLTADAAVYSGVDLGWIHYQDLIGINVAPAGPNGRYFRHITLMRDFETAPSYKRAGLLTWRQILGSYFGPVEFFDFDLKDWRVTADVLLSLFRTAARGMVRRITGSR